MKKFYIASILGGLAAVATAAPQSSHSKPSVPAASSRLEFVANQGQWDSHVKFLARSPGVDMWITDRGVTYSYYRAKTVTNKSFAKGLPPMVKPSVRVDGHVVRVGFEGAEKIARTAGMGKKGYYLNYFVGNDRSKWRSHVPVYSSVKVSNLYKGVDLVAYFDPIQKRPRYDLVVKPGADASKIALRYEGAEKVRVGSKGGLAYNTSLGKVEERDLFAYQPKPGYDIDAGRTGIARHDAKTRQRVTPVSVRMAMDVDGSVRFALGAQNRSQALVIDPLVWATYLDSMNAATYPVAIATGVDDSIYVAGNTVATDYPTTPGALPGRTSDGNTFSAYLSHLSGDGTTLLYSTVFGSSNLNGGQFVSALAVGADGAAVVGGVGAEADFPITPNAWQPAYGRSRFGEGFATKFSPDGASLVFSTFIGAGGNSVSGVAEDTDGSVHVTGVGVGGGVSTSNGLNPSPQNPGVGEGYYLKMSSDGTSLIYGTYLKGAFPSALALDANHDIYVTGSGLQNLVTTPGAFQSADGLSGGFLAKIHSDGSRFDYSTALRGSDSGAVYITSLAVDAQGHAFVVGNTDSQNYPTTPGAYWTEMMASTTGFVTKVSADGSSLDYSTYFAQSDGLGVLTGVVVDSNGRASVAGANYGEVPTTPGAIRNRYVGNQSFDLFYAKLAADGKSLIYSTYYGTGDGDWPCGLGLLSNGDVAALVSTPQSYFHTTDGVYQPYTSVTGGSAQTVSRLNLSAAAYMTFTPSAANSTVRIVGTYVIAKPFAKDTILRMSPPSLVLIPRYVTIPAGQLSVSFPVTTSPVDEVTDRDIEFSDGTNSGDGVFQILPAVPNGFSLNATSATGQRSVVGKLTLDGAAGPSGVTVSLSSSDASVANVPATVTIPSGKPSATFVFTTNSVSASGSTIITATDASGNVIGTQTLNVNAIVPAGVGLSLPTLYNGQSTTGRIKLNVVAPSGGLAVDLTVPDDYKPYFPAQVVVPAGASYADFTVNVDPAFAGPDASFALTAAANGASVTTNVNLKTVAVGSVRFSPGTIYGGYNTTITVTLNHAAPAGGMTVNLASSSPSLMVPTPVIIPSGAMSGAVSVAAQLPLSSTETVTITATAGGVSKTVPVTIRPLVLTGFTASVTTVKGGTGANLTVSLNALTAQDVTVQLHSDSASASLPTTVTIPAGSRSVTVPLSTGAVSQNTKVNLTANFLSVTRTLAIVVSK